MDSPLIVFFRTVPLFSALTPEELTDLLRAVEPRELGAGDTLFAEGDPGDSAFVIQSGGMNIYTRTPTGGELHVATLGAGAVLGELALLDGAQRSAGARASEPTQLLRLDRAEFDFLRRNLRPAAFKIIRGITATICDRLRETNDQVSRVLMADDPMVDAGSANERRGGWIRRLLSRGE